MPYKLRKAPRRDLYWVVNKETGKKHSENPLPKERAEAQMRALYASEDKGLKGGVRLTSDIETDYAHSLGIPSRDEWLRLHGYPVDAVDTGIRQTGETSFKEVLLPGDEFKFDEGRYKDLTSNLMTKEQFEAYKKKRPAEKRTYEEYKSAKEAVSRSRATSNPNQRKRIDSEIERIKIVGQGSAIYGKLFPMMEIVNCRVGEDGEMLPNNGMEGVPRGLCEQRHALYKEKHKSGWDKALDILTSIGDVAVDVLETVPGIGKIASTVYKQFPPPNSAYYDQSAAKALFGGQTQRNKVMKHFKLDPKKAYSLDDLSDITGVPRSMLQEVYNRGVGAYKTNPQSVRLKGSFVKNVKAPMSKKLSKDQWAMARVYSFLAGNPKHDNDLRENLRGSGIFEDFWNFGKRAVKTVKDRVVAVSQGIRYDYSPKVRKNLQLYGNLPIVRLYVRRDPLHSVLMKAINALTLGKFGEAQAQTPYDKMFHLSIEAIVKASDTSNKVEQITVEKNQVINVAHSPGRKADTESIEINDIPPGLTINKLLEGGKEVLGDKFFPYDAFHNNCQDFILALLKGSGLEGKVSTDFIKQELLSIAQRLPGYAEKAAKVLTDLGGLANVAVEGRGLKKKSLRERLM